MNYGNKQSVCILCSHYLTFKLHKGGGSLLNLICSSNQSFTTYLQKGNFSLLKNKKASVSVRWGLPAGRLWVTEWRHDSGCPGGPVIAAGALEPHQKSSLPGLSLPAPRYHRLFSSLSSRPAAAGLWWLALSPPTSPGCLARDGIEGGEGGEGGMGWGKEVGEGQVMNVNFKLNMLKRSRHNCLPAPKYHHELE